MSLKPTLFPARTALVLLASTGMVACSSLNEIGKVDYRSQAAAQTRPLDVPPDLSQLARDTRYAMPGGPVTASSVANRSAAALGPAVAPAAVLDVQVMREGRTRWLRVNRPPEQVWSRLQSFWRDNGFTLAVDNASIGVLETDWAENRAKIPQDFIRRTLGKVLDAVYSSGERDKFRTRVERTADGSTEITISHRGMSEEYMDASRTRTWWMPRASDPELENEFIKRLMVALGTDAAKADSAVASSASGAPSSLARAELQNRQGTQMILIREGGDVAWRRVGLTLDRSGFTVEDRDRSKGTYFVRFVDTSKEEPGFWRKLFGSAQGPVGPQRFRLVLQSESNTATWVRLLDEQGNPADTTDLGKRILGLLLDDLR